MKLIPVESFKFPPPGSEHFRMTCKNHPTAVYSTKNPYSRNLHLLESPAGFRMGEECPCPFRDMVVIVEDES